MKKLTLDLDQLTVDSFNTVAPAAKRGTVHAEQECTCYTNCYTYCNTCPGCPTCDDSACNGSCGGTCFGENTCDTCVGQVTCGGRTCDYSRTAGYPYCQCCPV
jgi:hypothetical protein